MLLKIVTAFLFLLQCSALIAQKNVSVKIITSGTNTSLRGMSIAAGDFIWVSGSNGTVGKSVDAGKTWRWIIVPGFEKRDFRDIEAFDSSTAIAMAVDNPAIIIKTTDGGATWKKVFERAKEGMFLDAMDFKNKKEGVCIGDPLVSEKSPAKQFYIIKTFDGGETWKEIALNKMPFAQNGEAIFAASGTNISFLDDPVFEYAFVTGGAVSNLYFIEKNEKTAKIIHIPVIHGKETTGTFSMANDKQNNFYCIGGDYKDAAKDTDNFKYTNDSGVSWNSPLQKPPHGYKSCICIINDKTFAACGTTGVDYATDGPKSWKKVSAESFNVCAASKGKQVFLAGEKGKIGKLMY